MEIKLQSPIDEATARSLKVGDMVLVSGLVLTGRDRVHKFLYEQRPKPEDIPFQLEGGIIYHCGPLIERSDGGYRFVVGGPTTSMRMEPYEWFLIEHYGIRAVIGKGGLGQRSLEAMVKHGAVYLHTVSGAGTLLAEKIVSVEGVWKEEFGLPEAMWALRVQDLPAIVTMDSHGRSIHEEIKKATQENLERLLKK